MKLSQFEPQVNKNVINAKVTLPSDSAAYGGIQSGADSLNKSIGSAAGVYEKAWLKSQNDKVIDATNDYQQRVNSLLNDENNGLFTMQGKNAEGIQSTYQNQEEAIRQEIIKQYGLDNNYTTNAFKNQIQSSVTSTLNSIDKYQRAQLINYKNDQLTQMGRNYVNTLATDPNNFLATTKSYKEQMAAIGGSMNMDQISVENMLYNNTSASVKATLDQMTTTGRYDEAKKLAQTAGAMGYLDKNTEKKLTDALTSKSIQKSSKASFGSWAESSGIDFTKMTPDEIVIAYRKNNPFEVPGAVGIKSGNATLDQYDADILEAQKKYGWSDETTRIFKSMGVQESTMNMNATHDDGDGDPTIGVYQFKSATASQYGLNPSERNNPHKSIAAAAAMFDDNRKTFGSDERGMLAHNGGASEQGIRNAIANNYNRDVMQRYSEMYSNSALSKDEIEKLKEEADSSLKAEAVKFKQAQQQSISNATIELNKTLVQMDDAGATPYQKEEYVKSALESNPLLANSASGVSILGSAVNQRQSYDNAQKKLENRRKGLNDDGTLLGDTFKAVLGEIGRNISTPEQLNSAIETLSKNGMYMTPKQLDELNTAYQGYASGKGAYAVKLDMSDEQVAAITGLETKVISKSRGILDQMIRSDIATYQMNNDGARPSPDVIANFYRSATTKEQVGPVQKGWFTNDVPMGSPAGLKALNILNVDTTYDNAGVQVTDYEGNVYYIPSADWEDVYEQRKPLSDYISIRKG